MARRPLPMRQIKELLRLKYQNHLSVREIARSCGLPASTVGDYLKRAELAHLGWPLTEELSESELLERLLKVTPEPAAGHVIPELPDWSQVQQELRRKGVTLQLLWQEYYQAHPQGYRYSRFCELYRAVGSHPGAGPAAGSCAGRKDVRGLGGAHRTCPRREQWDRDGGADLRGGAGGQQQDLCRSLCGSTPRILDHSPSPCVRIFWRCREDHGS